MKLRQVRSSFNAGELSSLLSHRVDVDAYQNGAAIVKNLRILPQGGVRRRPGTVRCQQIAAGPLQAEDFSFSIDQNYIFLFRAGTVDIHDGPSGIFIMQLAGPWTAAMIGKLSVSQQGDTMFVAHEDLYTQRVIRTGATTFIMAGMVFDIGISGTNTAPAQPYYKFLPPDAWMSVTFQSYPGGSTSFNWEQGYTSGTVVRLQSNYSVFDGSYVGQHIKWSSSYIQITSVAAANDAMGVVASSQLYIQLQSNPIRTWMSSNKVIFSDPFHGFVVGNQVLVTGAAGVGTTPSTTINGHHGVTFTDVGTWAHDTSVTATEVIYGGGDGVRYWSDSFRTRDWMEPAWSTRRGWPRSVTFDDQRLVFGGSKSLPNRIFESRIDAPFNFDTGTGRDNESIQAGIASQRVAIIGAVVSFKHLQIFTTEGEYFCPGSDNKPLSPATISFKRQSQYGISEIPPVEFDGSTLYVTRTNAVREFLYSGDDGGYSSPSLSMMAQHLLGHPAALGGGIVPVRLESQIETASEQESVAFVVRSDGKLAVLTFSRKEKVLGWGLYETEGLIKDVVSVNRRLFFVMQRGARWFLEAGGQDVYNLDCSTHYSNATPVTAWTIHADYASTTVRVLTDAGEDLGNCAVDGAGNLTIPRPATGIFVGYPFTWELKTLPPELNMQDGPTVGQPRRVVRVAVEVEDCTGVSTNGTQIELRRIEDVNNPPPRANGFLEFWPIGWDDKGQVMISSSEQGTITIKSVVKELEF